MARIRFEVAVEFQASAQAVWDELVDWKAHEAWIPATRVEVDGEDSTAVGSTFTAWTGIGKLALEDRMRVAECEWAPGSRSGTCRVEKLGPILGGYAEFTVSPTAGGSRVDWIEDVTMKRLPSVLAPVARVIGAAGFKLGMRRLDRQLRRRHPSAT